MELERYINWTKKIEKIVNIELHSNSFVSNRTSSQHLFLFCLVKSPTEHFSFFGTYTYFFIHLDNLRLLLLCVRSASKHSVSHTATLVNRFALRVYVHLYTISVNVWCETHGFFFVVLLLLFFSSHSVHSVQALWYLCVHPLLLSKTQLILVGGHIGDWMKFFMISFIAAFVLHSSTRRRGEKNYVNEFQF